jgi:hypothetical protein
MDMERVFFEVEPILLNVRRTSVFKEFRLVTFFALRRVSELIKSLLHQTGTQLRQKRTSKLIKRFLSESEWYKGSIIVYEWCPRHCELITSRSSTRCACEGTVCLLQTAIVLQGVIKPFHNSDMAIQKIRLSLK